MTEDELFQAGLLTLSEDLRMSVNGSADPMAEDVEADVVAYLRKRVAEWRPSWGGRERYDNAARELVCAALFEFERAEERRVIRARKEADRG